MVRANELVRDAGAHLRNVRGLKNRERGIQRQDLNFVLFYKKQKKADLSKQLEMNKLNEFNFGIELITRIG